MHTKTVKLPSGLEVTIRRPGVRTMQAVFRCLPMLGQESAGDSSTMTAEELDASIAMICGCCLEPKFAVGPAEGCRDIDELDMADFTALTTAVNEYAQLDEQAASVRPLSATGKAS